MRRCTPCKAGKTCSSAWDPCEGALLCLGPNKHIGVLASWLNLRVLQVAHSVPISSACLIYALQPACQISEWTGQPRNHWWMHCCTAYSSHSLVQQQRIMHLSAFAADHRQSETLMAIGTLFHGTFDAGYTFSCTPACPRSPWSFCIVLCSRGQPPA